MKFNYCVICLLLVTFLWSCKRSNNEVLKAFYTINAKLEESNQSQNQKLDSLFYILMHDSMAKGDFQIYMQKSQMLDSLVTSIKSRMTSNLGMSLNEDANNKIDFQKIDKISVDNVLFNNEKPSQIGHSLIESMDDFAVTFKTLFETEYPEVTKKVEEKFSTKNKDNTDWLTYNFKGFPAVATLTKLTQIQADLSFVKSSLIEAILAKQ